MLMLDDLDLRDIRQGIDDMARFDDLPFEVQSYTFSLVLRSYKISHMYNYCHSEKPYRARRIKDSGSEATMSAFVLCCVSKHWRQVARDAILSHVRYLDKLAAADNLLKNAIQAETDKARAALYDHLIEGAFMIDLQPVKKRKVFANSVIADIPWGLDGRIFEACLYSAPLATVKYSRLVITTAKFETIVLNVQGESRLFQFIYRLFWGDVSIPPRFLRVF